MTTIDVAGYDASGYLLLPSFVPSEWLDELRAASADFVDQSRGLTVSDRVIDIEPGHTSAAPRLRRLVEPVERHEAFRRFALEGPAADLAQHILGGPVRYHHSKLNYKWSDGGEEVKWHQDIQFWPHTDFTPLTIGVYLDDVDDEMGPMGVLPGSHRGDLYDLYDLDGRWTGAMRPGDIDRLDHDAVVWLSGPAGSVTVHNCCMVHGSQPNRSARPRPLLLQTYSAASSYPVAGIGANSAIGRTAGTIIGGDADQTIEIDGRTLHGAPNWARNGAPTIFGSQQDREGTGE